jgi:hypothetical protein
MWIITPKNWIFLFYLTGDTNVDYYAKYQIIWCEIIHIRVFRQIELKCLILWRSNPHSNAIII